MEVKPGYKETEIGVIPEDWGVARFSDLLDFRNGVNASKDAYGSGIRFINVLEVITSGHLHAYDVPGRVTLPTALAAAFGVQRGDVLFNRTSETQEEVGLAAVYLDDEPVVFGGFVIRGRPVGDGIDPCYSGYAFRAPSVRSQLIARGQGAIRANIGQRDLGTVLVPTPSVTEQKAIARALQDVDALIRALDRLIAKKRDLKQATMHQLLSGRQRLPGYRGERPTRRLGELGATFGGLAGKTKRDFGVGVARYITFTNIMANVVIDCATFAHVRVFPNESQNRVMKGDLFFNGSSETPEELGLCAVLASEVQNVFLNSFCFGFRMRPDAEADGLYLAYYFRSAEGRELLKALAQGAIRYNLSKTALLKVAFPLPQLSEQVAIAKVLAHSDAELEALAQYREKADAIKQGMMQELLSGRVRLV